MLVFLAIFVFLFVTVLLCVGLGRVISGFAAEAADSHDAAASGIASG